MKLKKLKLCAVLLLGIGFTGLHAQKTIPASGGNASGSGGSMSYTVGQYAYMTRTGTSGSVSQGEQQPFEISVVTGISDINSIDLIYSAYPNPATQYVTLRIENFKTKNLSYKFYDISGKLLDNKIVESCETNIDMSNLVIATYFLKVIQDEKEVKVFKIIKN